MNRYLHHFHHLREEVFINWKVFIHFKHKKRCFLRIAFFLAHFRALVVVVVVDTQQSSSLKPHTATPLPTIHQPEPAVERAEPNRTNDRGSQHTTRAKQKKEEKREAAKEKSQQKSSTEHKKSSKQASKRGRVECGGWRKNRRKENENGDESRSEANNDGSRRVKIACCIKCCWDQVGWLRIHSGGECGREWVRESVWVGMIRMWKVARGWEKCEKRRWRVR